MSSYKHDEWINAKGSVQGHRAHLRKNVSLLETVKAQFPHVIMVNLAYEDVAADGMPADHTELENLDTTEESIADQMLTVFGALFGLVVTSDGTRDLFFFLPTRQTEDAIEAAIDATAPSVDYDFSIHHDPLWQPYVKLLPSPS
jgi:hypothetical protein